VETVDELTIEYSEKGKVLTRELDKVPLSKGAWATVAFLYQDMDRKTEEFGAKKISIRRYKKVGGSYRMQSRFNISSIKQATQLVEVLNGWIAKDS